MHHGDGAAAPRDLDGAVLLVLGAVAVATQMLLRHYACGQVPETALTYVYCLAVMGALAVFGFVFKRARFAIALNYVAFYALVLVWFVPHDGVRAVPLFILYWLVALVLYALWAVWQEHVPFVGAAGGGALASDADLHEAHAQIVRAGFRIVEYAQRHGLQPAGPVASARAPPPPPDAWGAEAARPHDE